MMNVMNVMNGGRLLYASMVVAAALPCFGADCAIQDWPNLAAYRRQNAELKMLRTERPRVVFMGDSITESWETKASNLFATPGFVNRGISGQSTPQMLLRFRSDVIDLKPKTVVILAGTNDIAGNAGPATLETISGNIASMAELARAHGIRVILASVLPATSFRWAPDVKPAVRITKLNRWLRRYAEQNRLGFIDYYGAMADARLGLKREYSDDGVHPNAAGYAVMNRLVLRALGMR